MFKKRAAKQEQVDIGLEKIEKQQQGEGSDDEGLKLKTKKKIKPNPREEEEEDDSKKRVQEIIDAEMDDLKYKSNENMIGNRKDLATVYNEIDTDENVDARAIALKRMEISQLVREGKLDSNVYRGKNYSTQYTTKSDEQIRNSKVTGAMGPVRAPTNVRMTCRFDYDPSLCKDYHDTGYCVFGDSCLYLHDRGDYKNGQEQELEWEREQKRKQKALQNGEEEDSEADEVELKLNDVLVPKECQICGSKLRYPVKTICDHFFCEDCALKNYATSKTCYVCERNTQGVFSDATNIIIKLRKERQQEKKKLKFTVTSRKALKMLEDSEDSDDDDNQGQHVIISTSKGKKQKKKKEAKEVEVERTYVDENGIEITETILQRVGDDSDNDENDNEENDSQNGAYDEENEEENDVKKQGRDSDDGNEVEMQLALNATNRANKRQKFKASASDWAIV